MQQNLTLLKDLADYLKHTTCVYISQKEIDQIAGGVYPPEKMQHLLKILKTTGCLGTTHRQDMKVHKLIPASHYEVVPMKDTNASAFQAFAFGYVYGHFHKPIVRQDKLEEMVGTLRTNVAKIVAGDRTLAELVRRDKNKTYLHQFIPRGGNGFDIVKYVGMIQTSGWGSRAEFAAMGRYARCEVRIYRHAPNEQKPGLCLVSRFVPDAVKDVVMVVPVLERTYQNGRVHYDCLVPPHVHRHGNKFWEGLNGGMFGAAVNEKAAEKAVRLAERLNENNAKEERHNTKNVNDNSNNYNWNSSRRLGP